MSLLLALLAALAGLALAGFGVFWVGFQTVPMSFPELPSAGPATGEPAEPFPRRLPPALEGQFRRVLGLNGSGELLPRLETAVIWGRGRYRFYGFLVPMRFRSLHRPGESFFRTLEVTWFGRAVLRIQEEYSNGRGSRTLEGWAKGRETGEAIDQSLRQSLWREAWWAPAVLAACPWQQLSETRWRCPAAGYEAVVDGKSGRILHLEGACAGPADASASSASEAAAPSWRATLRAWQRFHGIEIPTQVWLRHRHRGNSSRCREGDAVFVAQGVAYNLDLPADLRQAHRDLSSRSAQRPPAAGP